MKPITPDDLTRLRLGYASAAPTSLVKRLVAACDALAAENADLRTQLAAVGPAQLALFPEPPVLAPAEVA